MTDPRRSGLMSLTSVLAAVTMMPPPNPSSSSSARIGTNEPALGSAHSAIAISVRPSTRPVFLPLLSIRGPTDTDAIIRPMAWASATVPFCSIDRKVKVGMSVPSMAATTP